MEAFDEVSAGSVAEFVGQSHGDDETPAFWEAVRWMRYHLDKLVRTMYARIREMPEGD